MRKAMKTHCDLIGLASKCRNPVVRNALLAEASARDAAERGLEIAAGQKRLAMRTWTEAVERQRAETWGAFKTRRANDPALFAELETLDARTGAAQARYMDAERARNALRRAGEETDKGGAARP